MKAVILILCCVAAGVVLAAGRTCSGCKGALASGDKFCPNCGLRHVNPVPVADPQPEPRAEPKPVEPAPTPRYTPPPSAPRYTPPPSAPNAYSAYSKPPESFYGLRGLAEVVCSPFEVLRAMTFLGTQVCDRYRNDPVSGFFALTLGVPTASSVLGSVLVTGDVLFGSLDLLSLGAVGDSVWNSRYKSPYVVDRAWVSGGKCHVHGPIGF